MAAHLSTETSIMPTVHCTREARTEESWRETMTRGDPSSLRDLSSLAVKSSALSGLEITMQKTLNSKDLLICCSNWVWVDIHLVVLMSPAFMDTQRTISMFSSISLVLGIPSSVPTLNLALPTVNPGNSLGVSKTQSEPQSTNATPLSTISTPCLREWPTQPSPGWEQCGTNSPTIPQPMTSILNSW